MAGARRGGRGARHVDPAQLGGSGALVGGPRLAPHLPSCLCSAGRDDFFNVGNIGWYALMGARNISGIYCVGLSTSRGDCYMNKLSVGSAADSMWVGAVWGLGAQAEVGGCGGVRARGGALRHAPRACPTAHLGPCCEAGAVL